MSNIDNRIVSMKFDNATFEKGVSTTLSTLGKLKQALSFSGGSKGLEDLQASANRFSLSSMDGAVTGVSKKFLAMSTIAITALSNITTRAIDAGVNLIKSLSLSPIMDGYREYETNLNSIQTILANTKASGATLDDVNKALAQLNHYSDKTIYNFSEMARNIGTFTAAGVDLQTSVNSIKGIANLAALSGSNSQQASTAMYQLSQAISAGRVSLQDWNSVVNAGMGGTTFQRALAQTAVAMGTLSDKSLKLSGDMKNVTINGNSFRNSITAKPGEKSWLTSKVLTNTLQQFTGDLTKAQLKAQGFNEQQIKAIQATAKTAQQAATKVKSITQLLDVAKETVGSGWAKTWQIVFGNFKEARSTFTAASNTVNKFLNSMSKARNSVLKDWSALGGRTAIIDTVKAAFQALGSVLKPIHEAFRDIFPATTGKQLYDLTVTIRNFVQGLTVTGTAAENLKRTFAGVFAVFDIFWQIIKGVASGIGELFGAIGDGSGSFLSFTAGIGDSLVAFDQFLKKGDVFKKFFTGLGDILSLPIKLLSVLAGWIGNLFSGFEGSKADGLDQTLGRLGERLAPLSNLSKKVGDSFGKLSGIFDKVQASLKPFTDSLGKSFSNLGNSLAGALSSGNFQPVFDAINTGLFAGLVLMFKKFFSNGLELNVFGGSKNAFSSISKAFDTLTGSMKSLQSNVQASTLEKIAIAIGILTASVVALSLIDSKKLTKALTAMAVGFGQLLAAMAVLVKVSGSAGFVKVPMIASSMVLLAGSVLILTAAVAAMGQLKWGTIGKGLVGIAGALVVIAGAMRIMPKGMVLQAAGLVLIGAALNEIALALAGLGLLSWEQIGKGLVGIAGALVVISGAIAMMPATMLLQAAGLVVVGKALILIGAAVAGMGLMSWEQIAKGLVTLAGALIVLAGGLYLMSGTLTGAAALVVAAGALALLAPVLVTLGSMSWTGIAKGLVALAGAFTVIGVAGLVLAPLVPALLGLGVAVGLLGAGFALAGAGALAFAAAFGIVTAAGAAGAAVLTKILGSVVKAIPAAMKAFGQGIVEFAKAIGRGIPAFTKAFSAILTAILRAIIKNIPLIGKAFMTLLDTALKILVNGVPKMVDAGLKIILGVLRGIRDNIGKIVDVAGDIIVKFLNAIGRTYPRIVNAGIKLIIHLINGIANAIDKNSAQLGAAAGHLATAIIQGMVKGLAGGISVVAASAKHLAESALGAVKNFLGIHSPSREFEKIGRYVDAGFAKGIVGGLDDVKNAFDTLNGKIKDSMQSLRSTIKDEQSNLKDLLSADKQDADAIAKTRQRLLDAQEMEAAAQRAHEDLTKNLKGEHDALLLLSKQYDDLATKISDAKQALQDAIKARNDASSNISSQYGGLPDVLPTGTDNVPPSVKDYTNAIESQAQATVTFRESLDKLSKMGLSDAEYQKLLDSGLGSQPFVDSLIAAGPKAVKALNRATKDLSDAAHELGKTGSTELYQAGVDSARGILEGLRSKEDDIRAEMSKIANMMTRRIRKDLKIKSPSRVFEEVGRYSNEGLAQGLDKYSTYVSKSAAGVANTALDTIKSTMSGVSNAISNKIDSNPVITPVLDLTHVKKGASQVGSILSAGVSFGQASTISADHQAAQAQAASAADTVAQVPAQLVFEQNNYSPKALSPVEIYRQTKNQLSLAKEALTT